MSDPTRADIVILAEAHNPSILSPEWVKNNLGIADEPTTFAHTPEFSLWDGPSYRIVLDRSRMQVISKNLEFAAMMSSVTIAKAYVGSLQHIPYRGIGFNWTFSINPGELAVRVAAKQIPAQYRQYRVDLGATLLLTSGSKRLRITLPASPTIKAASCNVHHSSVKEREDRDIILDSYAVCYEEVQQALSDLIGEGE